MASKKIKAYFKVDDEKIFDVLDTMKKKKDIQVDLVTCTEMKVTWVEKTYTIAQIKKMTGGVQIQ